MRCLVALLVLAGCNDGGAPNADAPTMHPDVNVAACGAIGMSCTTTCPNNLVCLSSGVCAPSHGTCGGFAGAMCQDSSLMCVYPEGNSAGVCMTDSDKGCLCAIAHDKVSGCLL
jgi:hypothetical protein